MSTVGLIVHQGRPEAALLARELSEWLQGLGHKVRMPPEEAAALDCADLGVAPEELGNGLDAIVTLGGDGSILRAVELVGESGVPILGVDFGELGYLTEVDPSDARGAVERLVAGDHDIDERMLLEVRVERSQGEEQRFVALNEAVVERASDSNTIRLAVHLDGEFFTTYAADGLIVATPTGSTAYAFSARGPIIDPAHRSMLLAPVSPHMLFDRSMVLLPDTSLRLVVDGRRPATVSVDGRRISAMADGDAIVCTASSHPARLVTLGRRRFHRVLKAKFGLNDR